MRHRNRDLGSLVAIPISYLETTVEATAKVSRSGRNAIERATSWPFHWLFSQSTTTIIIGILALLASSGVIVPDRVKAETIYFYSPGSNVEDVASLKRMFDSYLAGRDIDATFQPLALRQAFERIAEEEEEGLYILAATHFAKLKLQHGEDFPLLPALVTNIGGSAGAVRLLVTKKSVTGVSMLTRGRLASTHDPKDTRAILSQMFPKNSDVINSVAILTVPKDIDALMAVGFGMADAALTTKYSLEQLARINSQQANSMHAVGQVKQIQLVICALPAGADKETRDLLSHMLSMAGDSIGQSLLRQMSLGRWRQLTRAEKKDLNE